MRYGGAQECFELLATKYSGTAFVVLPQVANGTGLKADRWLDAVVASMWPSRGLWLHGFEIKVSRHDWLRELKQAEKADALYQHLDFFSVLTCGPVIEPGELPETWGHVEADLVKKRLKVVKEAPRAGSQQAIDRSFVMSLFRSFDKTHASGEITAKLKERFDAGLQAGKRDAEYELSRRSNAAMKNAAFLEAFQQAHDLNGYSITPEFGTKLGKFVRAFYEADVYHLDTACTALERANELLRQLRHTPELFGRPA